MKKLTNTVTTIVTVAAISLATSCSPVSIPATTVTPPTIANSLNGKYYPLTGIVTKVKHKKRNDLITFTCSNGNMFSFTAPKTDCWDTADLVSCIMDNNGTGKVKDDKVVTAMYAGSTKQLNNQYKRSK